MKRQFSITLDDQVTQAPSCPLPKFIDHVRDLFLRLPAGVDSNDAIVSGYGSLVVTGEHILTQSEVAAARAEALSDALSRFEAQINIGKPILAEQITSLRVQLDEMV